MGAVHRHTFEIVRKGYEPDAVDETILQLTIAKNDAEALVAKLQSQLEQQTANQGDPGAGDRVLAQAKDEARRIVESAKRQAQTTVAQAQAAAEQEIARARKNTHGASAAQAAAPQDITALLEIAERFETELTKIAKGALGDVGSIARTLRHQLNTPAAAPSPTRAAEQPTRQASARRPAPPAEERSSTLDMLRRRSNDQSETNGGISLSAELADDEGLEEARALAERLVAQRSQPPAAKRSAEPSPASTAHEVNEATRPIRTEPEESTSLASRIARERGETLPEKKNEDGDRGSFYSRRSARLPRIGDSAAAGALAAVKSVRRSGDGDDSEEDAAQTA